MQVKLYASLRQTAGTKMLELQVSPDTSIHQVLLELTRRYPALEKYIWKGKDELVEFVHVFVNGVNIRQLAGLETPLKDEDHVDIFPPVAGG